MMKRGLQAIILTGPRISAGPRFFAQKSNSGVTSAAATASADDRLFSLWRKDYNGNKVKMASNLTEKEADAQVEIYEKRGHHQTYWSAPTK